jgi:hypothetical protein
MAIRTLGVDQSIAALEKKLRQARNLQGRINQLQSQLDSLIGGNSQAGRIGKRRMSAAARRRISLAQKARWAKRRGSKTTATKKRRRKSGLTPAGRRKLSQMMKARWEAKRKTKA